MTPHASLGRDTVLVGPRLPRPKGHEHGEDREPKSRAKGHRGSVSPAGESGSLHRVTTRRQVYNVEVPRRIAAFSGESGRKYRVGLLTTGFAYGPERRLFEGMLAAARARDVNLLCFHGRR